MRADRHAWSQPATRLCGQAVPVAEQAVRPVTRHPAGTEVRRRDAEMAAERLGELRRLAVADAVRDLADGDAPAGQQLRGAIHPDAGQMLPEGRVADFGVRALE